MCMKRTLKNHPKGWMATIIKNLVRYLPFPDCDGNHDQLCEDESREGDGQDVDEFVFKQQECAEHDHTA